jgi:phenylpropionate dioxygenase-like ring-hydroxylating dioxygenase large terminal subunit
VTSTAARAEARTEAQPASGRVPAGWEHLESMVPGIPVSWYLSPDILTVEQRVLFDEGPGYVGHELLVPDFGDFHAPTWDEGWALVHGRDGIQRVSNVCRHRQSVILEGRGNTRNIVCPLHRWSYSLEGRQQAAPRFEEATGRDLRTERLQRWSGLLFRGPRNVAADLAGFHLAPEYDFDGFVHDRSWVEDYPINWKTFIEFYIEILHVEPFHPGLTSLIDCDGFGAANWELGDNWQNQRLDVGVDLASSRSDAYLEYQKLVVDHRGGPPKFGALWLCLYPNVMVEWYPESLIVSHVVPRAPDRTTNVVDFYYPADVLAERPEIVAAHQASYIETAIEDGVIADHMDRGRRALYARGEHDAGPYQHPMETGMAHFHDYLHRYLDRHVEGTAVDLRGRRS